MPKIDQSTIAKAAVPLPPRAEQTRITQEVQRQLSQVDATQRTLALRLRTAQELCQALLQDAFSGKLVPQDPNDEPASVLLERIRAARASAAANKNGNQPATPKPIAERFQRRRRGQKLAQPAKAGKG